LKSAVVFHWSQGHGNASSSSLFGVLKGNILLRITNHNTTGDHSAQKKEVDPSPGLFQKKNMACFCRKSWAFVHEFVQHVATPCGPNSFFFAKGGECMGVMVSCHLARMQIAQQ